MTANVYPIAKQLIASGAFNLLSSEIKVLLVETVTFDTGHEYVGPSGFDEITGAGYERKTLSNKTLTRDGLFARFTADDLLYASANFSAGPYAAVLYFVTDNDTTSPLICHIELSPMVSTTGVDFTIHWDANGILVFK